MNKIYNSKIELGTRAVFILNAISPHCASVERLAYFDYISIYSSEFNGPENLHPDVPLHQMEFIFRIENLKDGLNLMLKKQIINIIFKSEGIQYTLGEYAHSYLSFLDSSYYDKLTERCKWVNQHFSNLSDHELDRFLGITGSIWSNKK